MSPGGGVDWQPIEKRMATSHVPFFTRRAYDALGCVMATEQDLAAAVQRVNALPKPPSTSDMLELYGLYKQVTTGDVTGSRPGMFDPKARAKWDAWSQQKGTSAEQAREAYVALAKKLGA